MLTAQEVAVYLLGTVDQEAGDNITNMKLQKLLYYAQGFHAAMHGGEPLFPEAIQAWRHGPVVPAVYSVYKDCGSKAIEPPLDFNRDAYLPETSELLDAVNDVYGQYGASGLRNLSHREAPWDDVYQDGKTSVISLESITNYFENLVAAGRAGTMYDGHPVWPVHRFRHQRRREIAAKFEALRDRMDRVVGLSNTGPDPWGDE